MTHAEQLRKHAELAMREGGMYYSGEYLSRMAKVAESLESENAKLRELARWMYDRMDESCAVQHPYAPAPISYDLLMQALARVRELGVEL